MISSALLLLAAAASCGVFCVELNQPPSMVVKPQESFSISCSISESSYCINWIRQPAGKALEWLGYLCSGGSTNIKESVKNKISFTQDTSKNTVFLQGKNFQAEDTAVYYCAREGIDAFDYWGKGTTVTVTSGEKSPPKSIFAMSQCASENNEFITIGCLARGFSPADSLTFNWMDPARNELNDFVQYPAFGQDGDYSKISHLRVKKSELDPKRPYTCKASHPNVSTEVKVPEVPKVTKDSDGKTPHIVIYKPDIIGTDNVSLVCEVTSPELGNVNITWKVGNDSIKGIKSAPIHHNGTTSVLSILTMTKTKYEDPKTTITCALGNMADSKSPIQVSTSKSKELEISCD